MGKPTATAAAVLPHMSKDVGKATVWRTLQYPDVRAAVEEAMEAYGANIGWRIKTLKEAASPDTIITDTKETIGPNGERTVQTHRRAPTPTDAARCIDVLNRIDGTYDQQHAAALVSARFQSLSARFRTLMSAPNLPIQDSDPIVNVERKAMRSRRQMPRYFVDGIPARPAPTRTFPQLPPGARGGPTSDSAVVTHDDSYSTQEGA